MNDFFYSLSQTDALGGTDPRTALFIILLALPAGMLIGFIYMWTHEALSYSRTFVGALAVLPLLVAMMMLAMAGNLFVAFGLLGLFGIVRFRNVLKDTRDTGFILWSIMEGLAIGTERFSTALLALLGIGAAFLLLRWMSFGSRLRYDTVLSLRVKGDVPERMAALRTILKRHAIRQDLASERRASDEGTDVSYRLLLRDASRSSELQAELAAIEGFVNVTVYLHDDEAEI